MRRRPTSAPGADQVSAQNQASKADAAVLASARSAAASRALAALAGEKEALLAQLGGGPAPDEGAPTAAPPASPKPLLEVKPSPLNTDLDKIGERVVILPDAVELHDRNDTVLERIAAADIGEVVVQKRITGAAVTVEATSGAKIVAKGLRPEQAEEMRSVIQRKLRQRPPAEPTSDPAAPAPTSEPTASASPRRPADAATPPAPPSATQPDERPGQPSATGPASRIAHLLELLAELHAEGILTDEELAQKRTLVLAAPIDQPVGSAR